ncbi:MAG: NAD(P)H-hydrate epimerase, partial [Gemmatimonadetes bacterium]|nr:NAD(P)H-hydrate epimerase [Gemmatimonadota bacterium]
DTSIVRWADAVLLGPGLGKDARAIVERVLRAFDGPVVIDADALNAFAGDVDALRVALRGRPALLTPHPMEFARLSALGIDAVLEQRFTAPTSLAHESGAAVLLKGLPTVVAGVDGVVFVVAEGTPILATGGAGDVLGGIAVALLAQVGEATRVGALAAFAHGRAAQLVSERGVRGYTLDDVLAALPSVWTLAPLPPRPPVLGELAAVGEYAA